MEAHHSLWLKIPKDMDPDLESEDKQNAEILGIIIFAETKPTDT
nr:5156_t:CDS:2 [Entrophospora candida]